ncbi:Polyamine aminopropyltransferase [subsurface metagenome]
METVKEMKKILIFALILVGFSSVVSQVVLVRELLITFYGNELSVGFILASWLFWVGMGSWFLGRRADRIKRGIEVFILTQFLIWLLLPLEILLVRTSKSIIGVGLGEIIGPFPMFYFSFLVLAPLCLVIGFQFALGCRVYNQIIREAPKAIGRVYIYDAIGDMAGGIIFTFLLVYLFHSFHCAFLIGSLNLFAAFLLATIRSTSYIPHHTSHIPHPTSRKPLAILTLLLLALSVYLFSSSKIDNLQDQSTRWRWRGYQLVEERNSIYGNLVTTKRNDQYSFYENGLLSFTTSDREFNEYVTHLTMLEHPKPKKILLVGGGVSGGLQEILKHDPDSVDYVELDPELIRLAKKYLPPSDRKALEDKRVKVHYLDGRLFVKRVKEKYDLVMVNLPDPCTAQLNRCYTREFFKETKDILRDDGIISLGISSKEAYLGEEMGDFNASIYYTLKDVFPNIVAIPGEYLLLFASSSEKVLTYDDGILNRRFTERKIKTDFLTPYHISYQFTPRKISYLLGALEEAKGAKRNFDFQPISYYYDIVLWASYFYPASRKLFASFAKLNVWHFASILAILVFLLILLSRRSPKIRKSFTPLAIATTGFAGITLEVVLILAFQVLYGYLYSRIGLIVALFMVGLTAGALLMIKQLPKIKRNLLVLSRLEGAVAIYALLLPLSLIALSKVKGIYLYPLSQIVFPILVALTGLLVGLEFPLANKIYLRGREVGKAAGLLYGVDLFGSCLGALLASVLLIPILGIIQTCLIVSLFNLSTFILLISISKKEKLSLY